LLYGVPRIGSSLVRGRSLGSHNAAEVIAIGADRDSRQQTPKRRVERDRRAKHDAMAQAAWTQGYLYGIGKPKVARALARKRSLEKIRYRRAANNVARALDRNRKRTLENIR
jgi:hypothetical protein